MIVIEAGKRDAKSFDAKILFARDLANFGYRAVIDENTLPEELDRSQKYEVAPYLANIANVSVSGLVLIGAEDLSDETLMTIRSYFMTNSTNDVQGSSLRVQGYYTILPAGLILWFPEELQVL